MTHNIFVVAKRLITERKYDDARALLRVLGDDPKAVRWLNRLDEIDPPNKIVLSDVSRNIDLPQFSKIQQSYDVVEGEVVLETGKWIINTSTAQIDDSQTVTLTLNAEQFISGQRQIYTPALVLRWKSCQLEVFIITTAKLVSRVSERASVRIRFDTSQPQPLLMSPSTSKEAYFFGDPNSIFKQILAASRMVFSFTPINANSAEVIFDLRGIRDAIIPIKTICGQL